MDKIYRCPYCKCTTLESHVINGFMYCAGQEGLKVSSCCGPIEISYKHDIDSSIPSCDGLYKVWDKEKEYVGVWDRWDRDFHSLHTLKGGKLERANDNEVIVSHWAPLS